MPSIDKWSAYCEVVRTVRWFEALHRRRQRGALPKNPGAVIFDFDGVFTDNRVIVLEDGREAVFCHRGDGLGIEMLRNRGLAMLVISKERNPVVAARCRKLGLSCLQGVSDKKTALLEWAADNRVDLEGMIDVGNDINDLECLRLVGCGAVVADAHPEVIRAADLVLSRSGGHGAIRELCDLVLADIGSIP